MESKIRERSVAAYKKIEGTAAEAIVPSGSWGIWGVKCGDRTHDLRNHNPTL